MGSPPGQHLEDAHVALVSCPPPHCSVQGSQQVGSAAQEYVVEVGDPLLVEGRSGVGFPLSCFICLACPLHTPHSPLPFLLPNTLTQGPLPLETLPGLPRQLPCPQLSSHSSLFIL